MSKHSIFGEAQAIYHGQNSGCVMGIVKEKRAWEKSMRDLVPQVKGV